VTFEKLRFFWDWCQSVHPRGHEQWEHSDGRLLTIPVHGGRETIPPLFFRILKQLGLSLEQFQELR
jgi:predicted RNA binding protein YcfA (HicA-like mRNA interferase family)